MFARTVSIKVKTNSAKDFSQIFDTEILPLLKKQAGFRDEVTMISEDGDYVNAISLWDTKEQVETYDKNTYPTVLKTLNKFIDGAPKVRTYSVLNSTLHQLSTVAAA
jgi:heme-degrading monooxygenase HmoA